ncbi:MAG: molybdate ABC transporter substrate-binding protein [Armatimonadetes bacterium]|nr:molybdate ABC transporter substrate-binding protein [Armatimonadota bacterium]
MNERNRHPRTAWWVGAAALGLCLAACQPLPQPVPPVGQPVPPPPATPAKVELLVFAAASLGDVLPKVAAAYEKQHPDVHVVLNLAGTQQLRAQVESGVAVDVFISANPIHSEKLHDKGLLEAPQMFVRNRLILAVSTRSGRVKSFTDLAAQGRGAGREDPARHRHAGREDLVRKIRANIVSYEENVQQAASKVQLGEADAGFLYLTDAAFKTDLKVIELPRPMHVEAFYTKARSAHSGHAAEAAEFLAFLARRPAVLYLDEAGFYPMGGP